MKDMVIITVVISLRPSGMQSCHCPSLGQKTPKTKYQDLKQSCEHRKESEQL